jgi:hypothetical protein
LRICDFRVDHYKFADLRFVDQTTSEICGFAIAQRAQEFADLQTKKICVPTFAREGCLSGHIYPPNPQSTVSVPNTKDDSGQISLSVW